MCLLKSLSQCRLALVIVCCCEMSLPLRWGFTQCHSLFWGSHTRNHRHFRDIYSLRFLFLFILPFFALFSLKPLVHHPPNLLFHIPSNRRQYTVCHLHRCKSQHSHQWYVSQSVRPSRHPSVLSEWVDPSLTWATSAVSLSVLAQCMKMIADLSGSSPSVLFYVLFIFSPRLCLRATLSSSVFVFF